MARRPWTMTGARKLDGLLRSFLYWEPIVPKTARGLAEFLAPLTRFLRDEVNKALGREGGPLNALASEWREVLFPEADDAQFADAYAQTVTYALLLAQFEGADSLRPAFAVDTLQRQHTLLAEALRWLEVDAVRSELLMPIEVLERAIGAVDAVQIGSAGDPWLYFYEQFLGVYDPKLRKGPRRLLHAGAGGPGSGTASGRATAGRTGETTGIRRPRRDRARSGRRNRHLSPRGSGTRRGGDALAVGTRRGTGEA